MTVYTWHDFTPGLVKKLFLYGQTTTPAVLAEGILAFDNRIRAWIEGISVQTPAAKDG